jgi:hypothetical protein
MTQVLWTKALEGASLAILTRPRPGDWLEDDIASWRREGISIVLSMLRPDEASTLGLSSEAEVCTAAGIDFLSFPITDIGLPPSFEEVHKLASGLAARIVTGEKLGLHCRMSIGRSSMMAAAVLIETGLSSTHAFRLIADARGLQVPDTLEQRAWVEEFEAWLRMQKPQTPPLH